MDATVFSETGKLRVADLQAYIRQTAVTNDEQIDRLKRNLTIAIDQDLTTRQRQMLSLYYFKGYNMTQIGKELGVHKSVVSRTLSRAMIRIQRALKYSF